MASAHNRDFRRGTEEAWRPPPPLLRRDAGAELVQCVDGAESRRDRDLTVRNSGSNRTLWGGVPSGSARFSPQGLHSEALRVVSELLIAQSFVNRSSPSVSMVNQSVIEG